MAEALFNRAAEGRARARSAGTSPAGEVHPQVVSALTEAGIELSGSRPKALTPDITSDVDRVVTMGCGDECPVIPGATVTDWDLPDPAEMSVEEVRELRDEIDRRVRRLLSELL